MVSEQSVPEVPHTEAAITEEQERRCMAMLDNLLAVTKKQLGDLTGLAHKMTELEATLQPLVASIRASPPSGTATTSTPVTAMGHAMVAATHSADANSTAKRPARCSTVCLDRDPSVHTWAFTPATTPSAPPTITELNTASSHVVAAQPVVNTFTTDTVLVMPTKCSTEGEEHAIDTNHDVATTGFDTEVPTNCLTKGPRLDANDIGITNLAIVWPTGPEGMLFGFALNDGHTSILDNAYLRVCSCGAMEFRQPWPPPTQVGVMGCGVELRPTSRLSIKGYRGRVKWMPPWSPPMPGRILILGEGFWLAKNSTEVMCSLFSFNHMRVVSEEQQKLGEFIGNRAFYIDSDEEVVSWTMLFSMGSMLYADDNKKMVDQTVPVPMKSSSRMRLPPWSLPLKDNGIKLPQCDQHNPFIYEATCHSGIVTKFIISPCDPTYVDRKTHLLVEDRKRTVVRLWHLHRVGSLFARLEKGIRFNYFWTSCSKLISVTLEGLNQHARDPLFYRCPDLEVYAKEVDERKRTMLLVNKADLLQLNIRKKWAEYFKEHDIFWSAKSATTTLEGKTLSGYSEENCASLDLDTKIYGRDELLMRLQAEAESIVAQRRTPTTKKDHEASSSDSVPSVAKHVVVGFVGYSNVGKSSTTNALVGQKRTGVTNTPGKTKHFQTLIISEELTLCDCPGLVFPSFSSSRHEMVSCGVLPIDGMTKHREAIQVVTDCVPRNVLEQIYKMTLSKPKPYESQSRPPTAAELLRAYCASRGHVSHSGLPDETRAARQILKDYIDGKIPHYELPPGVTDDEIEPEEITGTEGPTMSAADESDPDGSDEQDDTVDPDIKHVLSDLESFDLATEGSKAAEKKKEASHKHNRKPQRKKDWSWRVGNDGSDGDGVQVRLGMEVLLIPWDPGGNDDDSSVSAWGQTEIQEERNVTDRLWLCWWAVGLGGKRKGLSHDSIVQRAGTTSGEGIEEILQAHALALLFLLLFLPQLSLL